MRERTLVSLALDTALIDQAEEEIEKEHELRLEAETEVAVVKGYLEDMTRKCNAAREDLDRATVALKAAEARAKDAEDRITEATDAPGMFRDLASRVDRLSAMVATLSESDDKQEIAERKAIRSDVLAIRNEVAALGKTLSAPVANSKPMSIVPERYDNGLVKRYVIKTA